MGNTEEVLEQMGVLALSKELGFNAVVLDDVGKDGWVKFERGKTHWLNGFYMAKVFHDADKIVQTCCLKTHRFGGTLHSVAEEFCRVSCQEGSRRHVRLHVGTAQFAFSAADDC